MKPFPLSKTYTIGSEVFSAIELRDPTFLDYRQIGPAYDVHRGVMLPDREAIFSYVERLITKPAAGALVELSVEDAMGLEDHVLNFFVDARISLSKRMNSSSASDGHPSTSTS